LRLDVTDQSTRLIIFIRQRSAELNDRLKERLDWTSFHGRHVP
jgi:hypothetical protein